MAVILSAEVTKAKEKAQKAGNSSWVMKWRAGRGEAPGTCCPSRVPAEQSLVLGCSGQDCRGSSSLPGIAPVCFSSYPRISESGSLDILWPQSGTSGKMGTKRWKEAGKSLKKSKRWELGREEGSTDSGSHCLVFLDCWLNYPWQKHSD